MRIALHITCLLIGTAATAGGIHQGDDTLLLMAQPWLAASAVIAAGYRR